MRPERGTEASAPEPAHSPSRGGPRPQPGGGAGPAAASRDARYAEYREAVRDRRLPLALVDADLLAENAAALLARAGAKPVRIASKSVRSVAVLRRVLALDARFRGVLCYSAAEAAHLAAAGLDDLLVAYPTVEPADLAAAAGALASGRRIVLTVDDEEQLAPLSRVARERGVTVPVCIDLDLSSRWPGLHFGVRRSPVWTPEGAVRLARAVARAGGLALDGLLGYEAQLAGLPDRPPGRPAMAAAVTFLQRRSWREVAARRGEVVAALRRDGHRLRFVNGGGTGSLERTREDPSVTEVTAGSGLYGPALFDGYRRFRCRPAALFALPVTRRPAPGILTCHGGGYVASGAAGPDRLPVPWLPAGARLLGAEGAGEVQTPVLYRGPLPLAIGDPIFFRHAKAGELCEHFESLLLVSRGRIVDQVATYRGEGRAFL